MGVDIGTYRCRIGTFRHGPGLDVILLHVNVNYTGNLQTIGALTFIATLLLMAGIESNPGPLDKPSSLEYGGVKHDMCSLLSTVGLDSFADVFKENMIGIEDVELMSNEDFKTIGITIIGIRLKITRACKSYLKEQQTLAECSASVGDTRKMSETSQVHVKVQKKEKETYGIETEIEQLNKEIQKQQLKNKMKESMRQRDELRKQLANLQLDLPDISPQEYGTLQNNPSPGDKPNVAPKPSAKEPMDSGNIPEKQTLALGESSDSIGATGKKGEDSQVNVEVPIKEKETDGIESEIEQFNKDIQRQEFENKRKESERQRDELRKQSANLQLGIPDTPPQGVKHDMCSLLSTVGLDSFADVFKENMIGIEDVELMSNEDFKTIGITIIGIRLKITRACKSYLKEQQTLAECSASVGDTGKEGETSQVHVKVQKKEKETYGIETEIEQLNKEIQQQQLKNKMKESMRQRDELRKQLANLQLDLPDISPQEYGTLQNSPSPGDKPNGAPKHSAKEPMGSGNIPEKQTLASGESSDSIGATEKDSEDSQVNVEVPIKEKETDGIESEIEQLNKDIQRQEFENKRKESVRQRDELRKQSANLQLGIPDTPPQEYGTLQNSPSPGDKPNVAPKHSAKEPMDSGNIPEKQTLASGESSDSIGATGKDSEDSQVNEEVPIKEKETDGIESEIEQLNKDIQRQEFENKRKESARQRDELRKQSANLQLGIPDTPPQDHGTLQNSPSPRDRPNVAPKPSAKEPMDSGNIPEHGTLQNSPSPTDRPKVAQNPTVKRPLESGNIPEHGTLQNSPSPGDRSKAATKPTVKRPLESENIPELGTSKQSPPHLREIAAPVSAEPLHITAVHDSMDHYTKFHHLLKLMGLTRRFDEKISLTEVTTIDLSPSSTKTQSFKTLPWIVLKHLVETNIHARDITVEEIVSKEYGLNNERINEISPLDVFIAIFHCCDAFLKQFLYKKMFMCHLAVPLLYMEPNTGKVNATVPVWLLRPILFEWKDADQQSHESTILGQLTKIISFARFGRPLFSKSKLQNYLLSNNKQDTFHNYDCPLGMSDRSLSLGFVEMSYFLPSGKKNDSFNEVLMFINIRGDMLNDFPKRCTDFLQTLTNIFIVTLDVKLLKDNMQDVIETLGSHVCLFFLILTNIENIKNPEQYSCQIKEKLSRKGKPCIIISTQRGRTIINAAEMEKTIRRHLNECLKLTSPKNLIHDVLTKMQQFQIHSDEDNTDCEKGKSLAKIIFAKINESGPHTNWKAIITPLQHKYWREWSLLKQKLQKPLNSVDESQKIKNKMKSLRESQRDMLSDTMIDFIGQLIKIVNEKYKVLYFIEWMKLLLDNSSRKLLPGMRKEYYTAWNKMKTDKSTNVLPSNGILIKEPEVRILEERLSNATFGIEHIFREIGQIYEAYINTKQSKIDCIDLAQIPISIAKLISYGHSLELLDGDASNIPSDWIKSVLVAVKDLTKCRKIMTLSVLGIQSSGKSTLLNTMFGVQFPVSAGRCTRGVYMQLLPVKQNTGQWFDHVMLVDSEGLRAPELLKQNRRHDNELATFVIGLSDITLLNVRGENSGEMNDFLEITVHAFLRLKAANKKLDLKQKCVFAHQNVAAINAADKLQYGVLKLVENLDKMAKLAAAEEKVPNITTFNQVIEFDGSKHVLYLPDLWQGDPPMAAVNIGYSTTVRNLKETILDMAVYNGKTSNKEMDDILTHANDLWKGICSEDFVFSFKNSLEIKAYLLMETFYKKITWQLESSIQSNTLDKSKSECSKCQSENDVDKTLNSLQEELSVKLREKKKEIMDEMEQYFSNCEYYDISINWKSAKLIGITHLADVLKTTLCNEIQRFAKDRKLKIMLTSSRKRHEEKLHEESIKLASNMKENKMSESQMKDKFEQIWQTFVQGIESMNENNIKPIKLEFIDRLHALFSTDKSILHAELKRYDNLDKDLKLKQLCNSFDNLGFSKEHIHICKEKKGYHKVIEYVLGKPETKEVKELTNTFFRQIDCKIKLILQEDNEIGQQHVNTLLHFVMDWFENTELNLNMVGKFTLTKEYTAKVCVYISCFAKSVFEEHNKKHTDLHGTTVQLKRYKEQVRIRFFACIQDRKAEGTAAELFANEVKIFIKELVAERLTLAVKNALINHLPSLKFTLIINMLTELVKDGGFDNFMFYIRNPKAYAEEFIRNKSSMYLFGEQSHRYMDLASTIISTIVLDIRGAILKACNKSSKHHSIDNWIMFFSESLSDCQLEMELFRDVKREKVVDFVNFKKYLETEMNDVELYVTNEFQYSTMSTVKWKNFNPLTAVLDRIWGCSETCLICGETCSKEADHIGSTNHECLQHRPAGLKGVHRSKSKDMSLSSCNFKVQSDMTYKCNVLRFVCNPTDETDCTKGSHPYKEYRTFLPSWDIAPSGDMEDTCKLWMWFMAKYKDKLEEKYGIVTDNVPEAWHEITETDALDSLRNVYTDSNVNPND